MNAAIGATIASTTATIATLNGGAISGIVIACIIGAILLGIGITLLVWYLQEIIPTKEELKEKRELRKLKRKQRKLKEKNNDTNNTIV